MRSLVRYSLIAVGLVALAITVVTFRPRLEQTVNAQANTACTTSAAASRTNLCLSISSFRENGPNGSMDEFVEVFNASAVNVTVSTLSDDPTPANGIGVFSSAGNGTAANVAQLACQIPGAAVIRARGWYLCGGRSYSLSNLGNNGGTLHSVPDQTIGNGNAVIIDIPNDAGLALLNIGSNIVGQCTISVPLCPTGFNFSNQGLSGQAVVLDKVGFNPYGAGAPAPAYPTLASQYCEGTCLQPVGDATTQVQQPGVNCPASVSQQGAIFPVLLGGAVPGSAVNKCYGESGQYKIERRRAGSSFTSARGDIHRDTDNNADDYILDAPNPASSNIGQSITGVPGVASVLGAASPHNCGNGCTGTPALTTSAPPVIGDTLYTQSPFDAGSQLGPRNAERRYGQDPLITNVQNDPLGTFILRLKYTNNSGTSVTGARFRIDDITTLCGGQAGSFGQNSTVATQEARNLRGPNQVTGPLNSPLPSCKGEGIDATQEASGGVFTAILKAVNHGQEVVVDSTFTAQTVRGSTLEDTSGAPSGTPAPGALQPFGGGSNSSWVVNTGTTVGADGVNGGTGAFTGAAASSGTALRIAVKFGVVKSGRFKLLIGREVAGPTPAP